MKFSHVLFAALLTTSAGYTLAQPASPIQPSAIQGQETVSEQEAAALDALLVALAVAATQEEKSQVLADAIANTPTLASKTQLMGSVQSAALQSGMSIAQFDTAVVTGLGAAEASAAGSGSSSPNQSTLPSFSSPSVPSSSGGGGGSPS